MPFRFSRIDMYLQNNYFVQKASVKRGSNKYMLTKYINRIDDWEIQNDSTTTKPTRHIIWFEILNIHIF